jgi:hypothetical protein
MVADRPTAATHGAGFAVLKRPVAAFGRLGRVNTTDVVHDPRPNEVVRHRRRSCTFGASRAHMIDERRGRQGECVALAERMALQQLQVSLFAPLPLRDGFKRIDVQRMSSASVGAPCWTRVRAEGSSRTTSRCFAQVTAATRCAKVLYSWWMTALPFRMRTIAVYRVDPSVCLRARIVAMLCSWRSQAILDTYMAPLQPTNSPQLAGIPQKRAAWKALEK